MSQTSPKIYLVAGATRGLGLALVDDIATKDPSAIIYAGARDLVNGAAQLLQVAAKYPGRVEVVKYVASDKAGNEALAAKIKDAHGRVDTVIANAAACTIAGRKVHETPVESFTEEFTVNTLGTVVLFQATRALLQASAEPRFIPIGSVGGSLELIPRMGAVNTSPYGTSKAALHWITRKIHFENEWLIAFPQCPGGVNTDMPHRAAETDPTGQVSAMVNGEIAAGMFLAPAAAASKVVDIIRSATREKDGGQFHNIAGERNPW